MDKIRELLISMGYEIYDYWNTRCNENEIPITGSVKASDVVKLFGFGLYSLEAVDYDGDSGIVLTFKL